MAPVGPAMLRRAAVVIGAPLVGHDAPPPRGSALAAALLATCAALAACTGPAAQPVPSDLPAEPAVARTRVPSGPVVLDGRGAVGLAAQASAVAWARSPVAVTVAEDDPASLAGAAPLAADLVVPLLVVPRAAGAGGTASASAASAADPLAVELERLGVQHVLHVGAAAPDLPGVTVVASPAELPDFERAAPQRDLTALTAPKAAPEGTADAALASLAAAGATPITLQRRDPRVDPDDVEALAGRPAAGIVGVGRGFGPEPRFTQRAQAAATGVQLPGGGQTIFDGKRYVALYGSPVTNALGVLGEQGPGASARRAAELAAAYERHAEERIVPAFEIIATVASGSAGRDRDYSNEWSVETLRPLVDEAAERGILVILDLQPGREDFLSQARLYEELLLEPHVGLALDPEWRLEPDQLPLQQIGSVGVEEVNATMAWLAQLTEANDLPQKMVLLHQFRTSMIRDRADLDLSHDSLAVVVQMDGDGTLGQKLDTWRALLAGAPEGLRFGWKNFYDEDEPTPSPAQTFAVDPKPWWVSYQ
jgi:hypothetical protein